MAFGLLLPLRIAQFIFAVVVVGLSAYGTYPSLEPQEEIFTHISDSVAHWYDADTLTASPSQINFLIFVPLFTFISIAYLEITPRFAARGTLPLPNNQIEYA